VALENIQARNAIVQDLKISEEFSFPNIAHPSCGWVFNKLNKIGCKYP
jgi:hypothetical protein